MDISNNMPNSCGCASGNGFGDSLDLVNGYCTKHCDSDLLSGKITEDFAAEKALGNGAKVFDEGAYQIIIYTSAPVGSAHAGNEEVIIHDTSKCSKTPDTVIWGDPHVDSGAGSSNSFEFNKNLNFKLQDGTNVFIDTAQCSGNTDHYVVSSVEISNDYSNVTISGVDSALNGHGSLSVGTINAGPDTSNEITNFIQQNNNGSWSFGNGVEISADTYNNGYGYGINNGYLNFYGNI